jgi:hypothetical protein
MAENRDSGGSLLCYEQLGAPVLLYRNPDTYTLQDERGAMPSSSASAAAAAWVENREALNRASSRWYYPVDYHVLRNATGAPQLPKSVARLFGGIGQQKVARKKAKASNDKGDDEDDSSSTDSDDSSADMEESGDNGEPKRSVSRRPHLKERVARLKRDMKNADYFEQQTFPLQLEARTLMLLTELDDRLPVVRQAVRRKLRALQAYDASYVPARERSKLGNNLKNSKREMLTRTGMTDLVFQQTAMYDRERRNRADPAYLAPFHRESLLGAAEADATDGSGGRRRLEPAISRDDPNAPTRYGNCLVCAACKCGACRGQTGRQPSSAILLHPVGPLLDRVRLDFVAFPRGGAKSVHVQEYPRRGSPEELDAGDRIRQLARCGEASRDMFAARTDLRVTVFAVNFEQPVELQQQGNSSDTCWGLASLKELHRINLFSLSRNEPSYRPMDMACHAKFGTGWTNAKMAIACESTNRFQNKDRNIIKHVLVGQQTVSETTRHVRNLQEISGIDFSAQHPMVLWSTARSYVRPLLTAGHITKRPRIGHGMSLYSIDLRSSSEATFQWSPSAEEFMIEGIHSLSGICTDWKREHSVWTSSVSAAKTWEIDTRMPCRTVNVWSLPHACDDCGPILPATGLYGAGTLFAQPLSHGVADRPSVTGSPMLGVGKSPGSFGLHLYQRPAVKPRFQTQSIECATCPGLLFVDGLSVATSSVYALPDVSDEVFTCGLSALRVPVASFLTRAEILRMKCNEDDITAVLCAMSVTNKGDLYAHAMLESTAARRESRAHDGLPVGNSVLSVPKATSSAFARACNLLRVNLSDTFPVPSEAINSSFSLCCTSPSTLEFPSVEDENEDEETGHKPDDGVEQESEEILPGDKSLAVVSVPDQNEAAVSLPRDLLHTRERDEDTAAWFQQNGRISVFEQSNKDANWRSDITKEILVKAWSEHVEASSDESD